MSKSIMIPEGGIARGFTAERLKVPLEVGGYELLVPESAVGLGELRATVNRRYRASEDGLFAYSVVKTDVPNGRSVTGKGPDGKKYKVTVDDGGNIVETPEGSGDAVRIAVTTPPRVTTYAEGAYLGFDGIVVTAYDQDDNSLGTVPFSELIFPVTVAVYDPDAPASTAYVSDRSLLESEYSPQRVEYSEDSEIRVTIEDEKTHTTKSKYTLNVTNPTPPVYAYVTKYYYTGTYNKNPTFVSESPFTVEYFGNRHYTYNSRSETYLDGREGYFYNYGDNAIDIMYSVPVNELQYISTDWSKMVKDVRYMILYGLHSGGTPVPVQWARPGDGTILETTFGITVVPMNAGGQGDD